MQGGQCDLVHDVGHDADQQVIRLGPQPGQPKVNLSLDLEDGDPCYLVWLACMKAEPRARAAEAWGIGSQVDDRLMFPGCAGQVSPVLAPSPRARGGSRRGGGRRGTPPAGSRPHCLPGGGGGGGRREEELERITTGLYVFDIE